MKFLLSWFARVGYAKRAQGVNPKRGGQTASEEKMPGAFRVHLAKSTSSWGEIRPWFDPLFGRQTILECKPRYKWIFRDVPRKPYWSMSFDLWFSWAEGILGSGELRRGTKKKSNRCMLSWWLCLLSWWFWMLVDLHFLATPIGHLLEQSRVLHSWHITGKLAWGCFIWMWTRLKI